MAAAPAAASAAAPAAASSAAAAASARGAAPDGMAALVDEQMQMLKQWRGAQPNNSRTPFGFVWFS